MLLERHQLGTHTVANKRRCSFTPSFNNAYFLPQSYPGSPQMRKISTRKTYKKFLFTFQGPRIVKYIPIIVQQDATVYSLFISANSSTCFGWYLHPSSRAHVTVSTVSDSIMPDTVDTVTWAPDDGWRYHPKHVEQFADINKLYIVASCWIIIDSYYLVRHTEIQCKPQANKSFHRGMKRALHLGKKGKTAGSFRVTVNDTYSLRSEHERDRNLSESSLNVHDRLQFRFY